MADEKQTTRKPRQGFLKGNKEGILYSKDNQPTGEAKSAGWAVWRAERHLAQEIVKQMSGVNEDTGEENLKGYVKDLVNLAKLGNSKAIETINNGIEDDIKKVELTGKDGEDLNFNVTLKL